MGKFPDVWFVAVRPYIGVYPLSSNQMGSCVPAYFLSTNPSKVLCCIWASTRFMVGTRHRDTICLIYFYFFHWSWKQRIHIQTKILLKVCSSFVFLAPNRSPLLCMTQCHFLLGWYTFPWEIGNSWTSFSGEPVSSQHWAVFSPEITWNLPYLKSSLCVHLNFHRS